VSVQEALLFGSSAHLEGWLGTFQCYGPEIGPTADWRARRAGLAVAMCGPGVAQVQRTAERSSHVVAVELPGVQTLSSRALHCVWQHAE